MRRDARALGEAISQAVRDPAADIAVAPLLVARLEYPELDPAPTLTQLARLGEMARERLAGIGDTVDRVHGLNVFLFEELGFVGNRARYDDPRNSCLNDVLARRTGIPITLAVIYMAVGRHAGLTVDGINFPGHFLVRVSPTLADDTRREPSGAPSAPLIVDPFHAGAILEEDDCRLLLHRHLGEDAAFDRQLLAATSVRQIVTRMLVNLKRLYVRMRSFPHAWTATELLLTLDPTDGAELRDRGLLSYHLNDFAGALRDLETYLHLPQTAPADDEAKREVAQLWEHVHALRRRVASFN